MSFLEHDLPLPPGETVESLRKYLSRFRLEVEQDKERIQAEFNNYLREELKRFLYTINILPADTGRLLEIGSSPYFTSLLVRRFTHYDLTCSNYFGADHPDVATQVEVSTKGEREEFVFHNFNIESDSNPFGKDYFDAVLFCEVIEHLTNDPMQALLNIKSMLKPDGHLILTTPNVNRLENIARMISGANMYDPYSGYGPYGRHNREYNKHELQLLLTHLGFDIEVMFTSDVHENRSDDFCEVYKTLPLVDFRRSDLGQYVFLRARNATEANPKKPSWLYRSYPPDELCD